jgi:hypothetical protein
MFKRFSTTEVERKFFVDVPNREQTSIRSRSALPVGTHPTHQPRRPPHAATRPAQKILAHGNLSLDIADQG